MLGKKSGLDSIRIKVDELGLPVPEERFPALLAEVKRVGTEKRGLVTDEELRRLAGGAELRGEKVPFPDGGLDDAVVRLRRLKPADAEGLLRGLTDPQLGRDACMPARDHTSETVREQIERIRPAQMRSGEAAELAIADSETDAFVGSITLHGFRWHADQAEIGYWVLPEARGRGVAARAVVLLTRWAVEELGLNRIEAFVPVDNEASVRTIERGGYTREGVARAAFDNRRDQVDLALFSFVRADLEPRRRRAKRGRGS